MRYVLHDILNKTEYDTYVKVNGDIFDFNKLFSQLNLTPKEQKQVAFLIGSHKSHSVIFSQMDKRFGLPDKMSYREYLKKLKSIAIEAGLSKIDLDQKMFKMLIALLVADIYSMYFEIDVNYGKSSFVLNEFRLMKPRRPFFKIPNEKGETEEQYRYSFCNNLIPLVYKTHNKILTLLPD
ncbi:hypothetical protein K9L05_04035 [Candidatus Babeliales bacterium]|nr:hypothetical protein [Candidatus Babeliales bacterium]MCF7899785.1 hypothetical protein [Candidatus Babeliales bacterium]